MTEKEYKIRENQAWWLWFSQTIISLDSSTSLKYYFPIYEEEEK